MNATINANRTTEEGFNRNHRKDYHYTGAYEGIAIVNGEIIKSVTLRLYNTRTTSYACIWANNGETYLLGSGKAGGYSYHTESAAASEAIQAAGITLSQRIDGVGGTAIENAIKAIINALHPAATHVVVIHTHA